MNYIAFKAASARSDESANDRAHFFSRHFAVPAAYLCYRLRRTPNQVTGLFLIVGLSSGVALYFTMPVLSYLLWRIHIILDMADGSLARATKRFSAHALGFDRSNHVVINPTILLASIFPTGNILLANGLVASFLLSYQFSRNFDQGNGKTQQLSLSKSFVRHALGLEGYIALVVALMMFGRSDLIVFVAVLYCGFFLLLFSTKLLRRING